MQIFIKLNTNGRSLTIDTEPSDTIENIKAILQEKEGFNPEFQKLTFGGRILDNEKILADYNIQKESTLYLSYVTYAYCFIIYGEGKRLKIRDYCPCCSNTLYLKKNIEEELGIDTKFQQLIIDGKIMKDNESLLKSGVEDGKEITLKIINNNE